MNEKTPRETPHIGIFWLVQTADGKAQLLAAGCHLDKAERYGECLTYGPGHYETWAHWRGDRNVDHALRALVWFYEYETSRADASSSTRRAMCSSFIPIASSGHRQ